MKPLLIALVLAAASTAGTARADVASWTIDPKHSQVRARYSHFGFSNIELEFRRFDGTLRFDPEDFATASLNATVDLASVDSGVDDLDAHLRAPDFFDVAQHPSARFSSERVEVLAKDRLRVHGTLEIHGTQRPAAMDVTVNRIGEHPMTKKPAAGFDATMTLKRSDFGVDKYTPGVSDEVRVTITVEAQKQS